MALITLTDPVSGTVTDATMIASNNAAILSAINGGLDNTNINSAAAIAYSKLSLSGAIVNSDISASAAIAASKLAGYPTDATKFLRGDGTWAVPGATTQFCAHNTQTTDVGPISVTTEGTASGIVTTSAFTYDGVHPVLIRFFCPRVEAAGTPGTFLVINVVLKRDSTVIVGKWANPSYQLQANTPPPYGDDQVFPMLLEYRETPTNASHTYTAACYVSAGNATFKAGGGGTGGLAPIFIRTNYDI